jgi:hypothetical protein
MSPGSRRSCLLHLNVEGKNPVKLYYSLARGPPFIRRKAARSSAIADAPHLHREQELCFPIGYIIDRTFSCLRHSRLPLSPPVGYPMFAGVFLCSGGLAYDTISL